jgi:2-oxo-4-hydroxy-4-carboxy-5-ureidoimidazoline decarboxylase
MTLDELNLLSRTEAAIALSRCCGSAQWAKTMALKRPFFELDELYKAADAVWKRLSKDDWVEAFSHHPKIGDTNTPQEKFASTEPWTESEQGGVHGVPEKTLQDLASGNADYEKKFGYIFIVCPNGNQADEILVILKQRLTNDPAHELQIAAEEQRKITRLCLEKLFSAPQPQTAAN